MSEKKPGFAYFKQVAIGAGSGLMAAVLLVGLFSLGGTNGATPSNTPSATPNNSSQPSASPTNDRTCSVAVQVADKRLGTFSGVVINPATKEVLFDRNANVPGATASVLKLLTAAAALTTLGPNFVVDPRFMQTQTIQERSFWWAVATQLSLQQLRVSSRFMQMHPNSAT